MKDTGYICSECGMAVIVIGDQIIRACGHERAVVFASMSAVTTGKSKLEQTNGKAAP
jgi:hypothetical protein